MFRGLSFNRRLVVVTVLAVALLGCGGGDLEPDDDPGTGDLAPDDDAAADATSAASEAGASASTSEAVAAEGVTESGTAGESSSGADGRVEQVELATVLQSPGEYEDQPVAVGGVVDRVVVDGVVLLSDQGPDQLLVAGLPGQIPDVEAGFELDVQGRVQPFDLAQLESEVDYDYDGDQFSEIDPSHVLVLDEPVEVTAGG